MSSQEHGSHVQHHFENADQQYQSAKLGMWAFLATEVLFFGGLFCAYAVYRVNNPEIFVYAHQFLDKTMGAVNTVILICSSFTMAWAVRAAQLRQRAMLQLMLALTLVCASGFLGVKAVEYNQKWKHGLLWAGAYSPVGVHGDDENVGGGETLAPDPVAPAHVEVAPEGPDAAAEPAADVELDPDMSRIPPAAAGPPGLAADMSREDGGHDGSGHAVAREPKNARIFFSIYFMMTGLHGIHVVLGMAAMVWLMFKARRGDFAGGHFTPVDMIGLYWHLVDLIWIYLFLLLYLIH